MFSQGFLAYQNLLSPMTLQEAYLQGPSVGLGLKFRMSEVPLSHPALTRRMLHLFSGTRNPKPETRNPKHETRNPKPGTRNPKPETRNPKSKT